MAKKSSSLNLQSTQKGIFILVILAIFIALSSFFFSYKGNFNLSNEPKNQNIKIKLAQGNVQISYSTTGELLGAYDSGIVPAFHPRSLTFYALQGNFHAAIPSGSDLDIDIQTLQGSVIVDTGETQVSSTKLNVGQGNILFVPSNRISSQHDFSIQQGNLSLIVPYGVDGLRFDTQGKKLPELDKAENYTYINGGYQSAGFDEASITALVKLSGSPKITSIKLLTEEETQKAYTSK